jgi:hypothetical protein
VYLRNNQLSSESQRQKDDICSSSVSIGLKRSDSTLIISPDPELAPHQNPKDDICSSSVSIGLKRSDSTLIISPDPELAPHQNPKDDICSSSVSIGLKRSDSTLIISPDPELAPQQNPKDTDNLLPSLISENPTITTDIESSSHNIFPPAPPDSIWTTDRTCLCCISDYENFDKLRVLPCGHKFHVACIDEWYFILKKG